MKKFLILIFAIFSFFISTNAFGYEHVPMYKEGISQFGFGLYFANNKLTVYEEPDLKSKIVAQFEWDTHKIIHSTDKHLHASTTFLVFIPSKQISALPVIDEIEGWSKVVYDQKRNLSGWVVVDENVRYYSWKSVLNKYARKHGLYIWKNTSKDNKVLRTVPDEEKEPTMTFFHPKHIAYMHISGNWILIKVLDYDNTIKVGWFKWRDSNGTLLAFPKFKD